MKMIAKLIALFALLSLMAACGGGGDTFTTPINGGGGTPGTATVSSIVLLTSSPQIDSAGSNTVTLFAIVKDASNVVLKDIPVTFSANSNGSIQVISGTTDTTGTAQATLSTAGYTTNRTITATAIAGTQSDTVDVSVTGTVISVAGATALGSGEQATLTVTLKDSAGTAISGEALTITSDANVTVSGVPVTTGANGQATFTVTGVSGTGVVSVSGAGATAAQTIVVSTDSFTFTTPSAGTEVNLGVVQTVTVKLLSGGVGVDGQTVSFTATRGLLGAATAVTAGGGFASVTVTATNAGPSVINATTGAGLTAQLGILFVATTANSMTLQASPATVGINPAGSAATQTSTVTATVRDPANNLVKNKTINFTLTDVSGGSISPASAITDEFGQASTAYTAGASASATDGVIINAVVSDTPSVNSIVRLTVAAQALHIDLGTGNSILEPNTTTYQLPYSVSVTDSAGAPVTGKKVTLRIFATDYAKGFFTYPENASAWVQTITAGPCANEDVNQNGIFDAGDLDINSNNILDPGGPITLSTGSVTTDSTGYAYFTVNYAQEYAHWVAVDLTANASVAGTESYKTDNFVVTGLSGDYTEKDVTPPGRYSPFGQGVLCSDAN